ncbi:MAG: hypothetical protein E6Q97_37230 [Desulfurellales bacterium]|nr:MAG: hypothetical protein E6Q97_37230 [Desulfurellales bacterium]
MGSSKDIKRQQKKTQKTMKELGKMIPRVKVRRSTGKHGAGCPCSVLMLAGILGILVLIGQIL